MTDIFDRATELEQRQREAALQNQRDKAHLGNAKNWRKLSAKWCVATACGERIPDERRRAIPGVQHCTDCQQHLEKYGRLP